MYWTLPVEWDFYVMLPLFLLLGAAPKPWRIATVVVIASILMRVVFLADPQGSSGPDMGRRLIVELPGRIDQFLFGVLAARVHLACGSNLPRWAPLLALAAVALLVALVHLAAPYSFTVRDATPWFYFHYTLTGLGFAMLVLAATWALPVIDHVFASRPLYALGSVSYSLYL